MKQQQTTHGQVADEIQAESKDSDWVVQEDHPDDTARRQVHIFNAKLNTTELPQCTAIQLCSTLTVERSFNMQDTFPSNIPLLN